MNTRGAWRGIAAVTLLAAVLLAYYWPHKPLDVRVITALGGAALDLLAVGLIVAVAGGIGRRALGQTVRDMSRAERIALEGMIGLGLLSLIALMLGLVGLYRPPVFWVLLIFSALVSNRALIGWLRDMIALVGRVLRPADRWTAFLTVIVITLLLTALARSLTPPAAFDALNYHLVAPAHYLVVGQVTASADNHFLGLSQGVEILFGLAMGLFGRDTAAAPLHYAFGLLGLLATMGLVRRYTNPATGWLAAALLTGAYSIWLLFGWPYVDLALLAYGAGSLVALANWRETGLPRWLVIMGVCAGFALGVKYIAGGLLLALGAAVFWRNPRRAAPNLLVIGLAAGVVFLLWAIKGALLYQNPVYPFFFGGLNWNDLRTDTFSAAGSGLLATGRAWQLPVLPLAATVLGVEKGEGFSFTAGAFLLTAPLLLIFVWRALDDRARVLAGDCVRLLLPLLAFWMVLAAYSGIGAQTRLMVMALPACAAAGALGFYGLGRLPRKPLDTAFLARALLAIFLMLGTLDALRETVRQRAVPYLLGTVSRDDYLTGELGIHINAMRQLAALPDGSQVQLLFEPLTYYCPPSVTCVPDILFDSWARALDDGQTPSGALDVWRAEGSDYLLMYERAFNDFPEFFLDDPRYGAANALLPDALAQLTAVWTDGVGGYTLYELQPGVTP